MNYTNKAVARHIDRALTRQERNRKMTKMQMAAFVAAVTLLLTGAIQHNNRGEYTEDTVVVHSGDTLWSIASEYCPDGMDKRDYVQLLQSDNGCTANIHAGDVLTVRIYK